MKFIPRAKRKALEERLATLDPTSTEAKEIRGKLGWGEPAPPAPKLEPKNVTPKARPAPKLEPKKMAPKAKPEPKKAQANVKPAVDPKKSAPTKKKEK